MCDMPFDLSAMEEDVYSDRTKATDPMLYDYFAKKAPLSGMRQLIWSFPGKYICFIVAKNKR